MTKYLLAWLPMVPLGILNGVARELSYGRYLSALHAHQLSTLVGALLTGLYIWLVGRLLPFGSTARALGVGAIWAALTVVFEFGFGRLVMGHPWSRLLHDYDLGAGRVWPLFLLWLCAAPMLVQRFGGGSGPA